MENPVTIDMESSLRRYTPFLFKFLEGTNLPEKKWRKLNENFTKDYQVRKEKFHANGDYLKVEANLYDTISSALNGNDSADRLLQYFSILFKRLDKHLSFKEKMLLRKTIYGVLINLDHKYRNFIGELAVLNSLVEKKSNTLIKVDKDIIVGNKTADFTVRNNKDNSIELVEVVNIHFDETDTDLKWLISKKLTDKIADKTNGEEEYRQFTLVPVVWAPIVDLKRLQDLYKSADKIDIPNVSEPFAYACFYTPDQLPIYRFTRITTLFTDEEIEVINPYI